MQHITKFFSLCFILLSVGCQEDNLSNQAIIDYFQLDKSLKTSNKIIQYSNDKTIFAIQEISNEHRQYQPLAKKVLELKSTLTNDFCQYIDDLRLVLIQNSGGFYTEAELNSIENKFLLGKPKGAKNKKAVRDLFLSVNGNNLSKATILKSKIKELSNKYLLFVEQFWDAGGIKGTIYSVETKKAFFIEQLRKELALTTDMNFYSETKSNKTWENSIFENKSVAMVLVLLRKLENDAIRSETAVINFLASNIVVGCTYDKLNIFSQVKKPVVALGDFFEATITLGQYSSKANYQISVEGQPIEVIDGQGFYSVKPKTIGQQNYTVKIAVTNPLTREIESFTKEFSYEVIKQ